MHSQEIVEQFIASWNRMDFDSIIDALADDVVYHNMPMSPIVGREKVAEYLCNAWRFSDCNWVTVNIATSGNTVLTERVDEFFFDKKKVSLPIMGTFEVRGAKIIAWRDYFDLQSYREQLQSV